MGTLYLVDGNDLTSVANAIRAKSGGSGQLAFPAGFVSEIGNIPAGETVYHSPYNGMPYTERIEVPSTATVGWAANLYRGCSHLKEFISHKQPQNAYQYSYVFAGCTALETCILERMSSVPNGGNEHTFDNCGSLRNLQWGSVGYPITDLSKYSCIQRDSGVTQNFLVITVYVNAADLASVPTSVSNKLPGGATNATVVYRSSTTGEVLT